MVNIEIILIGIIIFSIVYSMVRTTKLSNDNERLRIENKEYHINKEKLVYEISKLEKEKTIFEIVKNIKPKKLENEYYWKLEVSKTNKSLYDFIVKKGLINTINKKGKIVLFFTDYSLLNALKKTLKHPEDM